MQELQGWATTSCLVGNLKESLLSCAGKKQHWAFTCLTTQPILSSTTAGQKTEMVWMTMSPWVSGTWIHGPQLVAVWGGLGVSILARSSYHWRGSWASKTPHLQCAFSASCAWIEMPSVSCCFGHLVPPLYHHTLHPSGTRSPNKLFLQYLPFVLVLCHS